MLSRSVLVGAVLATAVSAQGPEAKSPRPPVAQADLKVAPEPTAKVQDPVTPATAAPVARSERRPVGVKSAADALAGKLAKAFDHHDLVLGDQPTANGPLFFRGANYKTSFDAAGWQFVAQPADLAAPALPLHFRTTSWSLAGRGKVVGDVMPTRAGNRVEYQHADFVEAIEMRGNGVEQTFRFDTLAQRGELVMTLAVTTQRHGVDRGDGITFDSATGDVGYTEAVAIDATGARIAAETVLEGDIITIRVPAAFVAEARLPLVIDPLVTSSVVYGPGTSNVSNPDLVWDEGSQTWSVAFERFFTVDDSDVYVQRLDADMAPLGSPIIVDQTFDLWQLPKIANLRLYSKNLVVAQVSTDAVAPSWIAGRIVTGAGALTTGQFDIERASVAGHASGDKLRPDVGGDPYHLGPTYFTVVWERAFSATDHDVHMKQVEESGVLRSIAPTVIDNTSASIESNPSISKTDGPGTSTDQRLLVVYQRKFSSVDEDIRGSLLTWDGQFVQVAGSNHFAINGSAENDTLPQASTLTDGGANGTRHFMVVTERTTTGNRDVMGWVLTANGVLLTSANLSVLEGDPVRQAWPQYEPTVESDGTRFAVSYQELHMGGGIDHDTRVSLFGFDTNTNTLVAHEVGATMGFTTDPEHNPAIASRFSSTGERSQRYAVVGERNFAAPYSIEAFGYDGLADGGVSTRATQCGTPLAISATGVPAIGMSIDFQIATAFPVAGFVFGQPISVVIPTCACILGVNGTLLVGNSLHVAIPQQINLVGLDFSAQGFTFGGGPCLGSVSVTDTLDFTIQ